MFTYDRTDDHLTLQHPGTRWLTNGFVPPPSRTHSHHDTGFTADYQAGFRMADAAHNLTVPDDWSRTDLEAYVARRQGNRPPGPTLLTGVSQTHARGARCGSVEVVVTTGLSNPARLPIEPHAESSGHDEQKNDDSWRPGTVNMFIGTTKSLDDRALVELLATAVEAKTTTLLSIMEVTGTTSDAIVVGSDLTGETAPFAGSATEVGAATRRCVREAIQASLKARYDDDIPTPETAEYGVSTIGGADMFIPE